MLFSPSPSPALSLSKGPLSPSGAAATPPYTSPENRETDNHTGDDIAYIVVTVVHRGDAEHGNQGRHPERHPPPVDPSRRKDDQGYCHMETGMQPL